MLPTITHSVAWFFPNFSFFSLKRLKIFNLTTQSFKMLPLGQCFTSGLISFNKQRTETHSFLHSQQC
jgi:hypothetical protein